MMVRCGLLLVIAVSQVSAFVAPLQRNMFSRHYDVTRNASPPASSDKVIVLTDAAAVSKEVQDRVAAAAAAAIKAKGHFALAIPGGSILKMLQGTSPSWAKDTTIAYVNHKCVQMTDIKLSTHAKATELFLKDWAGVDVSESIDTAVLMTKRIIVSTIFLNRLRQYFSTDSGDHPYRLWGLNSRSYHIRIRNESTSDDIQDSN